MVLFRLDNSPDQLKKRIVNDKNWIDKRVQKGFFANKFIEFCKRTDLHGYKYIVMEDISITERTCWFLAVLVSIGLAAYFVVTAYLWYARNPIVTVIESTHGAIWDVPFPAVTICDLNIVSRKAARSFSNNVTLPPNTTADNVFEMLRWVPLLHSTFKANETQKEMLYKLQTVLDLNKIDMDVLYTKVSPSSSCHKLVQRCIWKNMLSRCDLLFQPIFTQLNLCCVFNYYAVDTSVLRKNEMGSEMLQVEAPRRVASCGYQTGLTVLLGTEPDDYYSSIVASQGAMVFIGDAYNMPDLDSPGRMVNPSTEVLIALSPERTYATAGIKSFRPEQRQCYYNDEMKIGQFRQYSYHNCMAFRKVQIIKNSCDCVPFYFPLKEHHRSCNFKDLNCLENILKHHRSCNFKDLNCLENILSAPENFESNRNQDYLVECLPECEHYDYPLEVALGVLATRAKLSGLISSFFSGLDLENRSMLNVFFNDLVSTRYRRDVYLNWQNILASFGGLLSLMLGFTLISGFDLIIFFTFRVAYDALKKMNVTSDDVKHGHKGRKENKVHAQVRDSTSFTKDVLSEKALKWETDLRYGNVRF